MATDTDFRLTSPAFDEGGDIPRRFTCDGDDASPALAWTGAPADAVSLALIVDDPDARGFVHWVLLDAAATASGGLPEGISTSPDAPRQGRNDFGRTGYGGPCPPSGTHRYRFTLFAVDRMLGLTGTPGAADVRGAMDGHILAQTTLTGRYTRSR